MKPETCAHGFWQTLPHPFLALAPMADVTDAAFRQLVLRWQRPHVMFTEFVPTAGLNSRGRERLLPLLRFDPAERPLVAQLCGSRPADFELAAGLAASLGFDGVDVNAGCPDRGVEKQGGGAALMRDPDQLRELVAAVHRGAPQLPVSVKTRLGYDRVDLGEWLPSILAAGVDALTIHLRTRMELYLGSAHWDLLPELVVLVRRLSPGTLVIGNGDLASVAEGWRRAGETGADGVMFGRQVVGRPWFFHLEEDPNAITPRERALAALEHTRLFVSINGRTRNFQMLKKHYKEGIQGFEGAKALRLRLMRVQSTEEVEAVLLDALAHPAQLGAPGVEP